MKMTEGRYAFVPSMAAASNSNLLTIDHLSQRGAMRLAKRLQDYWHERHFPSARFWAEPIGERFAKVGTYELYRVVCNLVGGLPPRLRDE